jgi:telomerase reverse transcriptase
MRENILSYNHADILNVLNPSFHRSTIARFQTRDHHKRMEDARHLSKYVFPREYGLVTVFASAIKAHKYSNFADREDEIKVRSNTLYATCPT